jgi:hypothetical protein
MPVIQLVYASAANKAFSQSELRDLLSAARTKNDPLGITRLLLYHKQSFFQILEGEEASVNALYNRIERDPRHSRVLLLLRKQIEHRNFGEWSMGFIDVDYMAAKLPGFVKLFEAKSSFLELKGDSKLVSRMLDGFQDGKWRQNVQQ